MGTAALARRKRFEKDTFPHLDALWRTALWLTLRSSRADQLIRRTMTQAYLSWQPECDPAGSKARLFRTLTREFTSGDQINRLDWVTPEHFTTDSDNSSGYRRHAVVSVDRREQLLLMGISPIAVKGAIARLSPLPRLIMILHFRESFSYAEIAYITDLGVDSIKAILCRVRRLIPRYLLHHADNVVTESDCNAAGLAQEVPSDGSP